MRTGSRNLTLTAMVFSVAMMFIDQTIVVLALPSLQHELTLSPTGAQWIVNGYLLSLSALFAFGGRVADLLGHRRTVIVATALFALFSALCGATPTGALGETWIIVFRVLQGASAAFLFPAALAIVVSAYDVSVRGKYLAIFFSISGGLTAIGPIAGGYLTQWTWRAIFWVNVPVAIIAIVLTLLARPEQTVRREPLDMRGAALVCAGMALAVLGLQQASAWGWSSPATWACLVAGVALLVCFAVLELGIEEPLVPLRLFTNRGFAVDNAVLFFISVCFVPLFFFASLYAQIGLGESSSSAGLFLLIFFVGFTIGAQWGGRVLDRRGARPTLTLGCAIGAVGFWLWADALHTLALGRQWYWLGLAGVGMGMTLGPASTDALNRSRSAAYGAVTGVTQTVRNFAGSLGLAVLGSVLVTQVTSKVTHTLIGAGAPAAAAHRIARSIAEASSGSTNGSGSGSGGGLGSHASAAAYHAVQLDFASATRTVITGMAIVMAVAFVVALLWFPRRRETVEAQAEQASPAAADDQPATGTLGAGAA